MKIIKDLKRLKLKGAVVAMGNFDGVHKGHQKIIQSAVRYAWLKKKPSVVVTFDPHPQQVVAPERGLRLLTTLEERGRLIQELGADYLVVIKFDRRIQRLSPQHFFRQVLFQKLRPATVFVGFDFAFGRKRSGSAQALRELGEKAGIEVKIVRPVREGFKIIKSSLIREWLSQGELKAAVRFLGRGYVLEGRVVAGSGRGRALGFPTANLAVPAEKLIPSHGVYSGYAWVRGKRYKAAIYIGSRPTFAGKAVTIEAYILNFRSDILGEALKLELMDYFHGDLQFADAEKLRQKIAQDVILIKRKRG